MGFEDLFEGTVIHEPAHVPRVETDKRKSVFDRLSSAPCDSRLEFSEDVKRKLSFADVVGDTKDDSLSFFPLENKAQSTIRIPVTLAQEAVKTHHTTLIGYFLGTRLHFPVVQSYVKTVWGKHGFVDAMMNNNGVYFFKFNDEGGCKQVIDAGPLMIRGVPLFVAPWDPLKGLSKPVHDSCPLWIKLHNIPLVAFNKEGIGRIASALGVPKQMDACTSAMCDKAWGRPGFAKVLVEVWAVGDLKRELEVVIPNLSGGEDAKVMIRVEYIWEPTQCSHCLVFGHKSATCAKAVVHAKKKQKDQVVDDDGFVRVERKQWKPKRVEQASSSGVIKEAETITQEENVIVLDKEAMDGVPRVEENEKLGQKENVNAPDKEVTVGDSTAVQSVPKEGHDKVDGPVPPIPNLVEPVVRNMQQQQKPQIRGILKNPIRNPNRPLVIEENKGKETSGRGLQKEGSNEGGRCQIYQIKMVKFGCWNIRGLNTSIKQREVRDFIKSHELSFCALVETHVKADSLSSIIPMVFGAWKWVSNSLVTVNGTRIVLAWDECVGDVMILDIHPQFLHCVIKLRGVDPSFFATIVYGSNSTIERRELWSGLRKAKVLMGNQPWVILGDFNTILFPHDGYGSCSRRNLNMEEFYSCVEDIEIMDVNYSGVQFMWTQKPRGGDGVLRKLDRIMSNTSFLTTFDGSLAVFVPRGISDHAGGIIDIHAAIRKRGRGFRFDNFITEREVFLELVAIEWKVPVFGSFMHQLLCHLKNLKQPLRRLRDVCGDVTKRVANLRVELDTIQIACDLDPTNPVLLEDLAHLFLAYEQARRDEDAFFRQRAKVNWLRDGDHNTKFFHNVVKERKSRNFIRSIADANGRFVHDEDVGTLFVEHFRNFLGIIDPLVDPTLPNGFFQTTLDFSDSLYMIRPITDEEIKWAMFHIGNDKAPGSDGFTSKFFKSAWSVVGSDVQVAIHNFFYSGRLTKELNHTLLCFIPKVPNATRVTDFRPISCCNVLYKVISKIIAERMKPFLSHLIGSDQSAFIPGRRISGNILMAHELVAGYQRDIGRPRCAFKIDLRKAYDTVNWRYLIRMLHGFGFHPVFCKWIDEMLNTSSFSIALNGDTFGFFKGARGLRQGDPISPYLFTIVMEGFSIILRSCIAEAENFHYHQGCEELSITHLCFADDLFVFTGGDLASIEVLKRALDRFRLFSGLEPNLSKSEVFFSNVSHEDRTVILNHLPFQTGTFPIRYLGVPLSPVSLRVSDFAPLVNKVKNRIHNWKAKFLSFGGRKQLIVSVLQSMQLYWMSIYVLPSGVVHELESCFRDFLWTQGSSSKGKCKIAWNVVCRPINSGGLGFKRLALWNRAFLAKHVWDILCRRNSLWVNWIWRYCIRNHSFWDIRPNQKWSWLFRKILNIRPYIREFFFFQVGTGTMINAWRDTWLSAGPLSSIISYRRFHNAGFDLSSTARDVILNSNGHWPPDWVSRNPLAFQMDPPLLTNDTDLLRWKDVAGNGVDFSVKEAWSSMLGICDRIPWTKYVWFKGHIPC
ncbi:hypothetical protein OSB04_un000284 [Centaurea solstitialis]|uniref:Reverse transcriptase domain-containing protein n=1 Tax=Centaurea solstitialis TaxID=347529 RepID=A0AA38SNX2_9ASTR|nr:hypothetical protein OSB04_un000284 [Centaurea solstitialis]